MANFAIIISWLAIIGIIVGVLFPKKSLFWYLGKKSRANVFILYSLLLLMSFILFAVAY